MDDLSFSLFLCEEGKKRVVYVMLMFDTGHTHVYKCVWPVLNIVPHALVQVCTRANADECRTSLPFPRLVKREFLEKGIVGGGKKSR